MRICLFSSFFLPRIGGIENASRALAEGWAAQGHAVRVITATAGDEGGVTCDDTAFPFTVIRNPDDARWREILADSDVVVSNGFSLRHIRHWRRARIPFGWIHGMVLGGYFSTKAAVMLQVRRVATRLGDFNICVSASMKRHICNGNAVVIPNAISPMFRPMPEVAPTGRFLFFGRMWKPKGMHVLLEAIAEGTRRGISLPTDFVGEGDELEETRGLADALKVADLVRFFPAQSGDQLVRTINASLAVVVPSVWAEPFGLIAAEAMACGKCVIASRTGGLAEVVEGAGILYTNGDAGELATCLADIQRDTSMRQKYEALGLRRAADFSPEAVCGQYIEVFERVTHSRRRAGEGLAGVSAKQPVSP